MPPKNPKQLFLSKLTSHYEVKQIRGSDVIALNSKAILYLRYNKNAGATKNYLGRFWFGVTKTEYDKYAGENLFIVCVCGVSGDEIDSLVFPSDRFDEIRKNIPLQSGQWKFNLLKGNDQRYALQVSRRGSWDVTQFLNYFDFSPMELRQTYAPQIGAFSARPQAEELAPSEVLLPFDEELLQASRDSSNPKRFEIALERFFNEIGFHCKRIGGSGETDVLVEEPVRFIVEGKSTKADSKAAVNFARIKRHMRENNAEFMVIVSVGFDPAVGRDAESEGATLVNIDSLRSILKIHGESILSPFEYAEVFKQPGIMDDSRLSALRQRIETQAQLVRKCMTLLDNLDFTYRNLDEIKGRVDLYCEQRKIQSISRKSLENALEFLSHDILGIVRRDNGKYSLLFTSALAREKLKSTIRKLCTIESVWSESEAN